MIRNFCLYLKEELSTPFAKKHSETIPCDADIIMTKTKTYEGGRRIARNGKLESSVTTKNEWRIKMGGQNPYRIVESLLTIEVRFNIQTNMKL